MLRKPTQMKRRTVTQVARVILGPEKGAGEGAIRHVTVSLPENPGVAMVIGPQESLPSDICGIDDSGATPEDVAFSRAFQWPEPDAGRDHCFNLLPNQWVAAMALEGLAKIAIIVEYCTEPR